MQTKMHFSAGKTRSVFSEQIRIDKKLHMSAVISASFLFVFGGLAVFPVANRPDDTQAANTISETTLAMTTEDIALTFDVDNPNGTFSASDPTEFTVITNNYSGYTLSISAKEDNANNSKLINDGYEFNSISSASSQSDFTNGTWGYKPSKINSAANTSYLPAPSYAGDTLDVTAAANNQTNTYSITLGAKADYSLPAGDYINTFVITAVGNPVGYQISYDDNTEDTVTNMPEDQNGDVTTTEITIASEVPVRSGYSFINWCSGTATTTIGIDSCDATVYQPDDAVDMSQITQNVLTLKAMWEVQYPVGTFERAFHDAGKQTTIISGARYYSMQDMAIGICEEVTPGQEASLVDSRDNTIYTVGKLVDGKCWLLDNLALDLTDSNVQANLTSTTTNASDTLLGYLKNGGGATSDRYATDGVANWGSTNPYTAPLIETSYKDAVRTGHMEGDDSMKDEVIAGNWKTGVFYNYCAASAGGNCNESTTNSDAAGDICPVGWHMPTGGLNGEYQILATAVTGLTGNFTDLAQIQSYRRVLHLPVAGYYYISNNTGTIAERGGFFWSSSRINNANAYQVAYLGIADYGAYLVSGSTRYYGQSVRCVANKQITVNYDANDGSGTMSSQTVNNIYVHIQNNPFTRSGYIFAGWNTKADGTGVSYDAGDDTVFSNDVTLYAQWGHSFDDTFAATGKTKVNNYYKMQDMTADTCASIAQGQTSSLIDIRDNTVYTVGKLADGRCWLLDNLALDLTDSTVQANLTSTTTNASDTLLGYLKNGGGAASDRYAMDGVAEWGSTSNSYTAPLVSSTNKNDVATVYNSADDPMKDEVVGGNWKTGIYYNYCAASAGGNCHGTLVVDAIGDICPAGWHMPTGEADNGEYTVMTKNFSDIYSVRAALRYSLTGYYYNGNIMRNGGYSWASTKNSSANASANNLRINGISNIYPSTTLTRFYGATVRCVANRQIVVSYDANGGSGTMPSQTVENIYIAISNNSFTRSGYVFAGWNTKADGTGAFYSGGDIGTFDSNVTLYAQWGHSFDSAFSVAGKTKVNNYYKMQDMSSDICASIVKGQTGSLIDIRDNTVYTVGKLKDSKCWLLDNLAIDITNTSVKNNLTQDTTNASNTTLNYLKNGGGSANGQYATNGVTNFTTTLSNFSTPMVDVGSKNIVPSTYVHPAYGNMDDPMKNDVIAGQWKVGGYYNICAASAGSHCYEKNGASGNVVEDICPAGWKMPSNSELVNFTVGVEYGAVRKQLHIPLSGSHVSTSNPEVQSQGASTAIWSATFGSQYSDYYAMYSLYSTQSQLSYSYSSAYVGYSVRCIAK